VYSEVDIEGAILAIKNFEYRSLRKAASAFGVPNANLQRRMSGRKSRATAYEAEQILLPAEKKTSTRWSTRLICTRLPDSPALPIEIAKNVGDMIEACKCLRD
jgi:hypothetical protein